jgi:hypothetical protein
MAPCPGRRAKERTSRIPGLRRPAGAVAPPEHWGPPANGSPAALGCPQLFIERRVDGRRPCSTLSQIGPSPAGGPILFLRLRNIGEGRPVSCQATRSSTHHIATLAGSAPFLRDGADLGRPVARRDRARLRIGARIASHPAGAQRTFPHQTASI